MSKPENSVPAEKHTVSSGDDLVVTHWGAYRPGFLNGELAELLPFDEDPDPSPIGGQMIETFDDPCRIDQPMIRKGFLEGGKRDLRGQDDFVAVEWEEALDYASGELDRVRNAHGNEAIYAGSYGWASAGRFHHAQSQLRRFMNLFGGCTVSRNSYSYAAGEVILPHVVAPMDKLLQEHSSWQGVAQKASLVVAFGGIALRNSQVNSGGLARHTQRADMIAAMNAGARIVNVNPSNVDFAGQFDCEWMPIRANTDLALMLGLAHEIHRAGLHDREFLDRYCTGFDRFADYLTGLADGQPKDAAWAADITGLSADSIAALAKRMGSGPTVVNASWSLTRQHNGESIYWMTVVLAAMLGGIGKTGEGFALGLGAINGVGSQRPKLSFAALPTERNPLDSFIPVARIADMLLNPGEPFRYDGKNLRYPDIRLVYWAGGNPFHHHQDLNRLRQAWRNVETVIVHEPHWTPLARHADIVFPATLSAERNDIAGSPRDTHLFATRAIRAPFGQAKNDHDIFAALARRLRPTHSNEPGFEERFTEGRSETEWLEYLYGQTRRRCEELGHELPEFSLFREKGAIGFPVPDQPAAMLCDYRDDPVGNRLSTPSGRIEIFSETIAGFGLPGHPYWHDPREWSGAALAGQYPLHLVTHQPERRLHSQLDHGSYSKAGKIGGREPCRIHPGDADLRGIGDGDAIRVYNGRGSCLASACITHSIRPGTVLMATGAWYDPDIEGDPACCKHGNPNTLTSDVPTSPLAQGPSALSCLVEIERLEGDPPVVTAHCPPVIRRRG